MFRVVVAMILGIATAQAATTPNQEAENEAISYLKPCHQTTAEKQGLCEQNQLNFVEQYVYAKAGDVLGMGSTAMSFGPRDARMPQILSWLGMPEDHVQGCAWRIVRFARSHDPLDEEMVHHDCDRLTGQERGAAFVRAGRLAHELNTAPAAMPPDDWCVHIPWIKVDCSGAPTGPLTTTATPLKPD